MDKYVVVHLNEDKAKKLSQVLANRTSKRILEYVAEKPATESDIAEALKMPLSTVHYNLKLLEDAKMAIADEYHYSKKGKVVNHYRVAKHLVVIAPVQHRVISLKAKLAAIVPAVGISLVGTWVVYALTRLRSAGEAAPMMAKQAADVTAENAARVMAAGPTSVAAEGSALAPTVWQQAWPWFLIGALIAIAGYLFFDWMFSEKNS